MYSKIRKGRIQPFRSRRRRISNSAFEGSRCSLRTRPRGANSTPCSAAGGPAGTPSGIRSCRTGGDSWRLGNHGHIMNPVPSIGRTVCMKTGVHKGATRRPWPPLGIEQGNGPPVVVMHRRFLAPEQARVGCERQVRFRQTETLHHRFVDGVPDRVSVSLACRQQSAVPELREGRGRNIQRAVVQHIETRAWNLPQSSHPSARPPRLPTLVLCPMGDQAEDGAGPQGTGRPRPHIAVLQRCPCTSPVTLLSVVATRRACDVQRMLRA